MTSDLETLFDRDWYKAQAGDRVREGGDLLNHYLERGGVDGISPSREFNGAWYLSRYTDVRAAGMNPLRHYLDYGASESRDPGPHFSTSWYLQQYSDVRIAGVNPLVHYVRHGRAEGRSPSPHVQSARLRAEFTALSALDAASLFDAGWYEAKYRKRIGKVADLLVHYKQYGATLGLNPNPLFDTLWYLAHYRGSMKSDVDPLTHFFEVGSYEGYDPSPFFDTRWYGARYPEVEFAGINPLAHYLHRGRHEGRRASACFETPPSAPGYPPSVWTVDVPCDYEADELKGYVGDYTTLAELRRVEDARSLTTPDRARWIVAPLDYEIGGDGSSPILDDVLVLAGAVAIFRGDRVIGTSEGRPRIEGMVSALVARVTHAAAPTIPVGVHLLTDTRKDVNSRLADVRRKLALIAGSIPDGASLLLEDDLGRDVYTEVGERAGSQIRIVRLKPGSLHRVKRLITSPDEKRIDGGPWIRPA